MNLILKGETNGKEKDLKEAVVAFMETQNFSFVIHFEVAITLTRISRYNGRWKSHDHHFPCLKLNDIFFRLEIKDSLITMSRQFDMQMSTIQPKGRPN